MDKPQLARLCFNVSVECEAKFPVLSLPKFMLFKRAGFG